MVSQRTFLDCCRPYKDNTYVKVTVVNQALRLALVAIVDAEVCRPVLGLLNGGWGLN